MEMVRWGVAGPGGIAVRFGHGMTMVEGGRITAVASRSQARADAYADQFGVASRYAGYEALADDPDVDVVYVATPHSRHEQDAMLFLEAGKHVLCEKPFALSAAQGRRMVEAARARGLFLMEAMWSRFLPSYRRLVDLVGGGRIGAVRLIEADFGFRVPIDPAHRLFAPELGGGATLDLGIYPVHLSALLLGHPDRVSADGTIGETGVDEQVAAVLHHASGALGVVKAAVRTSMTCTARIAGTEGSIDLPAFMHCPQSLTVHGAGGTEVVEVGWDGEGLRFQVDEVHRCLAEGRTESDVMPLEETIAIASTLDAIRGAVGVAYPGEEGAASG